MPLLKAKQDIHELFGGKNAAINDMGTGFTMNTEFAKWNCHEKRCPMSSFVKTFITGSV